MDTRDYTVKGVKTFRGMEGHGFNASLYKGGKRIAFVIDSAHGGDYNYEVTNEELFEELEGHIKTLPDIVTDMVNNDGSAFTYPVDMDSFVAQLVEADDDKKWWKRKLKNKTCFILKDTPEGRMQIINAPFSPKVKAVIMSRYGDKLVEIYNETKI